MYANIYLLSLYCSKLWCLSLITMQRTHLSFLSIQSNTNQSLIHFMALKVFVPVFYEKLLSITLPADSLLWNVSIKNSDGIRDPLLEPASSPMSGKMTVWIQSYFRYNHILDTIMFSVQLNTIIFWMQSFIWTFDYLLVWAKSSLKWVSTMMAILLSSRMICASRRGH